MDKYEYKVRADEIKELIAQGDYVQAAEIADTIDWRRVKSVMMLCTISDLYKINRRYEDARDMLLLAYERRPGGRTICYSLCELSIKMDEFVQAVEYYKEFVQVAPKDSGRYILQYKLFEAQDVSLEERIEVLEELKKHDYREKWAYELAYLYHRVGLATRCVEECDEMILWFGDGKYVIKAMELKMLHQPLDPQQQEKYDKRFGGGTAYGNTKTSAEPAQEYTENQEYTEHQEYAEAPVMPGAGVAETGSAIGDTKVYTPSQSAQMIAEILQREQKQREAAVPEPGVPAEGEMDIHVKTMDVGQYNTMNLQAELAAGLREVLGDENEPAIQDPIMRSIVAPMMEADTESGDYPQTEEADEEYLETEQEEMEESEVFFGETGEIGDLNLSPVSDDTAEIVMEQMRLEEIGADTGDEPEDTYSAEPPKELAGVLSQESDGQISLVMPESENVEKQITGQMNIEDILAEWERMKRENEEKRKEEVRRHVMQQTGSMFTEFEASVRDGLLEQLESGKIESVADAAEMAENATRETTALIEEDEIIDFETYESEGEGVFKEAVDEFDEEDFIEDLVEEATEEAAAEEIVEEADEEVVEEESTQEVTGEDVAEESAEEPAGELVEEEAAEESAEEESVEEAVEEAAEESAEEESVEEVTEETVAGESVEEAVEEPAKEESAEKAVEKSEVKEPAAAEEGDSEAQELAARLGLGEQDDDYDEIEDLEVTEKRPIVERDKAKIRALTRDERELFATFIQSKSAREQLVQALDNISLAAYTGNVIITGEEGMDTLTLAKNMVREIQMTDSNFSGKVAKITGSALNQRDVAAIVSDLKNGALIIQKAADMNSKTAAVLNKSLQQETTGIVVVLEDTKRAMNHFLSEHVNLHKCFTARMDVEALSNDTLVAFGRQYARGLEYAIDEMGMLALHTRIADMQTSDHVVTVVEVKKIIDEAIFNANKKTVGHFFDVLMAKRYDDEDMIILSEKDFA